MTKLSTGVRPKMLQDGVLRKMLGPGRAGKCGFISRKDRKLLQAEANRRNLRLA